MQRCFCLVACIVMVSWASATALAAERKVYQYLVEHPSYGTIGTYTDTVEQSGDTKRIDTKLRVAVKMLGIAMHREEADRTEEWRGDRLISFHSVTVTNGTRIEVSGHAQGDEFVISTPHGTVMAPANVYPSTPWAVRAAVAAALPRSAVMMSTKTGDLKPVQSTESDQTVASVRGVAVPVRHFTIETDKHHEVWLNDAGVPLRFSTEQNGAQIEFVLAPSATASLAQAQLH
jgi:Family of unknown function (DUF6134)